MSSKIERSQLTPARRKKLAKAIRQMNREQREKEAKAGDK